MLLTLCVPFLWIPVSVLFTMTKNAYTKVVTLLSFLFWEYVQYVRMQYIRYVRRIYSTCIIIAGEQYSSRVVDIPAREGIVYRNSIILRVLRF